MSNFAILWFVWIVLGVGYEMYALGTRRKGSTLSEWTRNFLRPTLMGRLSFYPLVTWLVWHWLIDPQVGIDFVDFLFAAIGVLLAFVAIPRPLAARPFLHGAKRQED